MSSITKADEPEINKATVKPLNDKEIEAVKSAIGGMSEQEMKLAAEILPIEILFDRIQREVVVGREKLNKIAAIINE